MRTQPRAAVGRLQDGWRFLPYRLPRWNQYEQGHSDGNEHSRAEQKPYALAGDFESQNRHCRSVSRARPRGEGDQAAMRCRISHRDEQKNAEDEIETHIHGIACVRVGRV